MKVTLWRFTKGVILTRSRVQEFANLVDISCPLCSSDAETELHIMAGCEITRLLWFKLLGLHMHSVSFTDPLDFLASVVHENKKFAFLTDP